MTGVPGPLVFHGTLAGRRDEIPASGLRFQAEEPCFTDDPALAACKYAHPGRSPHWRYSGRASREAAALRDAGSIDDAPSEEAMLDAARRYWDGHAACGVVFVVAAEGWRTRRPSAAHLSVDTARREVRGGITKWIEHHLLLEPVEEQALTRDRLVPPAQIVGWIRSTPSNRGALTSLVDEATGRAATTDPAGLLDVVRTASWRWPAPVAPERVAAYLAEAVKATAVRTALRRAALSVLRDQGYRIVKADFAVPYEEDAHVFWDPPELDDRISALAATLERTAARRDAALLARIQRARRDGVGSPAALLDALALGTASSEAR